MSQPPNPSIRELLLLEVKAQAPKDQSGPTLQQRPVLDAVARKLGATNNQDIEQAILTEWDDLYRTGLFSWGLNLMNPNSPFFHLTDRGRTALEKVTRDPSNPAGYLRHLHSIAAVDSVAFSYLAEALDCYVAGRFKAAAVMVGAASERIILELRDNTVAKLTALRKPMAKGMSDWRIKTISDALRIFLDSQKAHFGPELCAEYEAYWGAFAQQIRAARNDAGHPTSVDPVTPDTVHCSLLMFPELARLANKLGSWVSRELT